MADFGAQLLAIAEKNGQKLEDVDRAFKLDLFTMVVGRTRVADPASWKRPVKGYLGGTMRGGWQVSTGAPIQTTTGLRNTTRKLPPGEAAKIQPFSSTWLSNPVEYARYWEPVDGMIALAVADAKRRLARVVSVNKD